MLKYEMGIGVHAFEYIRNCMRSLFKERENYLLARRAYNSFLRAYARLPFKEVFNVKSLDLTNLVKSFGMNTVASKGEDTKE